MPSIWEDGGPDAMILGIRKIAGLAHDNALHAVQVVSDQGAVNMSDNIERAVTKTGVRRMESGGATSKYGSIHPGRVDSGNMLNQVDARTFDEGDVVAGEWGWFTPQHYFLEQENGEGLIPAMHALHDSFDQAVIDLQDAVDEAVSR